MRHHVNMTSSGAGSAVAGHRLTHRFGADNVTLLFADVNGEHSDNYRFLLEAWKWIDAPLVVLDNGGRTIWDVFHKSRFIGNSKADLCSRVLKREVMRAWLEEHHEPENTTAHIGYDISEGNRIDKAKPFWTPYEVDAPLCWPQPVWKDQALAQLELAGILPPWLTRQGMPHANCGGMCVRMGHKQAKKALTLIPGTYKRWEFEEELMRAYLDKDVSILSDRRGSPKKKPMTLQRFRERQIEGQLLDSDADWGSCSCVDFSPGELELPPDAIDTHCITDPIEVEAYLLRRQAEAEAQERADSEAVANGTPIVLRSRPLRPVSNDTPSHQEH